MPQIGPTVNLPLGGNIADFIVSEANGYRSREEGAVLAGSGILPSGMVMMRNGAGKYLPYVVAGGNVASAILYEGTDASGAADVRRAFIVRDAEIQRAALSFSGTPSVAEKDAAYAMLGANGLTFR
jgi:hypothetical protein